MESSKVEVAMNASMRQHHINFLKIIIVAILATLFLTSIYVFWKEKGKSVDYFMSQDIERLSIIFNKIQQQCYITGFESNKNPIDFLNVISFSGSQVGSMNLAFPQKWQGPYLKQNLKMQNKFYEIFKNKQG